MARSIWCQGRRTASSECPLRAGRPSRSGATTVRVPSRLENDSQMQRRVQAAVTKLNGEQERAGAYSSSSTAKYSRASVQLAAWHSYRSGLCCALFAAGCPDAINQLMDVPRVTLLAYRRMGAPPRTARESRRRRTRRSTPHAKRQRAPGRPRRVRCRAIRLHGQRGQLPAVSVDARVGGRNQPPGWSTGRSRTPALAQNPMATTPAPYYHEGGPRRIHYTVLYKT